MQVDFIVRKETEYREAEFLRRRAVSFSGVETFIVSREDLILWAAETKSEMQLRDIKSLVRASLDGGNRGPGASLGMSDTSAKFSALVSERHAQMSADERMQIASDMFDTARKIIESSLPGNLSQRAGRLAVARRLYNDELPEAALSAHADWESGQ